MWKLRIANYHYHYHIIPCELIKFAINADNLPKYLPNLLDSTTFIFTRTQTRTHAPTHTHAFIYNKKCTRLWPVLSHYGLKTWTIAIKTKITTTTTAKMSKHYKLPYARYMYIYIYTYSLTHIPKYSTSYNHFSHYVSVYSTSSSSLSSFFTYISFDFLFYSTHISQVICKQHFATTVWSSFSLVFISSLHNPYYSPSELHWILENRISGLCFVYINVSRYMFLYACMRLYLCDVMYVKEWLEEYLYTYICTRQHIL